MSGLVMTLVRTVVSPVAVRTVVVSPVAVRTVVVSPVAVRTVVSSVAVRTLLSP